ncbi:MAG: DUF1549 domain-containing protein [Gemmataceae bacterium]
MPAASTTRFWAAGMMVLACGLAGTATSHAAVDLPGNQKLNQVDFERHIMGLFGKVGCNSGSCHGSFQGKGNFRLSLFGYDPNMDYTALTRDVQGRRIDPVNPDNSLLLLKATGAVDHGGSRRFSKDSWQYQVFREWIANGAQRTTGSGDVKEVIVNPPELVFQKQGQSGQLEVRAKFADGSEEVITPFCEFRSNDEVIADVDNLGFVESFQAGDTVIVVSYRGHVTPVRVLVPTEVSPGFVYPKLPENNYIDQAVFTKLRRLNIVPSELSSDEEFLRRVHIDTIGSLPTPDEVRAFLADKDPKKRSKKIDELLEHPLHAALWATKFSDITGNNTDALENPQNLRPKWSQMWHDWFRKRIHDNMPYDQIVHGVLCATSRDGRKPDEWAKEFREIYQAATKGYDTSKYAERESLDLFWRRQQNVTLEQWGEKTAAAFMGVRLECAQCHKHPFDRWTQEDYRAYANIFGQVTLGVSSESKQAVDKLNKELNSSGQRNNQRINVREIYVNTTARALPHPETNARLTPKAPAGPEIPIESGKDAREVLFQWLVQPDNPFFARSFVNRVWGHYFGIGIVEPVDDFALGNPPSNPQLLDALAKDFVAHKFDIRHIERTILNSRVYQLSSSSNPSNRLDNTNFSHAYVRPLMAEVVVDVLNTALGATENFGNDAPPGARAIEIGSSRLANQSVAYIFRIFGRSPRTLACDCERALEPALPQKLFLMTDQTLLSKLQRGRVAELAQSKMSDDAVLEEIFLATLTRYPTDNDRKLFQEYLATGKDRRAALTDVMWALINTREFILNH